MRAALFAAALLIGVPAMLRAAGARDPVPDEPQLRYDVTVYGMSKEEFGTFIEEHVRKAIGHTPLIVNSGTIGNNHVDGNVVNGGPP